MSVPVDDQLVSGTIPQLIQQAAGPVKQRFQASGRVIRLLIPGLPEQLQIALLCNAVVSGVDQICQQQPNLPHTVAVVVHALAVPANRKLAQHIHPQYIGHDASTFFAFMPLWHGVNILIHHIKRGTPISRKKLKNYQNFRILRYLKKSVYTGANAESSVLFFLINRDAPSKSEQQAVGSRNASFIHCLIV